MTNTAKSTFEELSINSKIKNIDRKSIEEAKSVIQSKLKNLVNNPEISDLEGGDFNLNYKIDGSRPYKFIDMKNPRDSKDFPLWKKPESLSKMSLRIGKKITKQKII